MYEDFARVYDEFMQTIPYPVWADFIESVWKAHHLTPELVLDLGCGTGSLTLELSQRGYDMIGIDASGEMLNQALEKAEAAGKAEDILYLCQDMREFELYGTVQSILSTCDCLNYILEKEELSQVFALAANYLEQDGLFIFDLNTEYKYRELLKDNVFADTTEDAAFIWQNYYYEEEKINEYELTLFMTDDAEQSSGSYLRSTEIHLQKAYSIEEMTELLEANHFRVEAVYDGLSLEAVNPTSERITFVARQLLPKRTE